MGVSVGVLCVGVCVLCKCVYNCTSVQNQLYRFVY